KHWLLTDDFTDGDIACHAKLTKQSGICLYGTSINELFPDVPDNQFWESISYDVSNFDVISENKVYAILSLCRIWSYYITGKIMSKYEAAILGLDILPSEFHSLIMNTLHDKYGVYERSCCTDEDALCFKSYIIKEINNKENNYHVMTIMKADLLDKYRVVDHKTGVTFLEINKDEMYDENSDADIPFKYIQFKDGSVVFAVIAEFMDFAKKYFQMFSNNLFDKNTFEILFKFISDNMKKCNKKPYRENDELEKYMSYYILCDKINISYNKIQSSTVKFNSDTSYMNITDSYKELSKNSIYFGTLINGNIVSITGTNTAILQASSGKVIDIGLETHPDFRQKGYALSNVIAMSDYLLSNDYIVKYCCNSKNTNSNKTALSCGFKEIAREKTIWCVGE
ncbi:MAG: aminoglycoside adenylyltransferase domain-containing protein, partial [Saccharofermentanales bacterium]